MSDEAKAEQIDRDAAADLMVHIGGLLPRGNMADVEADIAGMFARHRLAEREAIVAWLRSEATIWQEAREYYCAEARVVNTVADAISQGAHLQEQSRG